MKRIVITGVTSGFGIEWLYTLDHCEVAVFYILVRNPAKFQQLVANRPLENPYHLIHCDCASLTSVKVAADKVAELTERVDLLVNNAGVWSGRAFTPSADNVEVTLAVNQLAPYVLTGKLLPLLKASDHARVVNTASFLHKNAKPSLGDIQLTRRFNAEAAYCNSKLYTVLFTQKLAKILSGTSVSVNCFDPGIVDTPMLKTGFPKAVKFLYPLFRLIFARAPKKGAETGVYLSTSSGCESTSGQYYKNCKIKSTSKLANNKMADWLWLESERLSDFRY